MRIQLLIYHFFFFWKLILCQWSTWGGILPEQGGKEPVLSCLLLSQSQISLLGGSGWVEGCLFLVLNHRAFEVHCECTLPGWGGKVGTTSLCRNLWNNKRRLTTTVRHKERQDRGGCLMCEKLPVGFCEGRTLCVRAPDTLFVQAQPDLSTSHTSPASASTGKRFNMLVWELSSLTASWENYLLIWGLWFFPLNLSTCVRFAEVGKVDVLLSLFWNSFPITVLCCAHSVLLPKFSFQPQWIPISSEAWCLKQWNKPYYNSSRSRSVIFPWEMVANGTFPSLSHEHRWPFTLMRKKRRLGMLGNGVLNHCFSTCKRKQKRSVKEAFHFSKGYFCG